MKQLRIILKRGLAISLSVVIACGSLNGLSLSVEAEEVVEVDTASGNEISQINEETYKINYELAGGTNHALNPDCFTVNSDITLKDPERVGYIFEGWYLDSYLDEKITKIPAEVEEDITVYAKWILDAELQATMNPTELLYLYDEEYEYREEYVNFNLTISQVTEDISGLYYRIYDLQNEEVESGGIYNNEENISLWVEKYPKGEYTLQAFGEYAESLETYGTVSSNKIPFRIDYEKRDYPINKNISWSGVKDLSDIKTFQNVKDELEFKLLENIETRIDDYFGEKLIEGQVSILDKSGNVISDLQELSTGMYKIIYTIGESDYFNKTSEATLHVFYETQLDEEGVSGKCGDNIQWVLKEDGTLVISGYGAMDYEYSFQEFASKVINVEMSGNITSISEKAFYNLYKLKSVEFADSITEIGYQAFWGCSALETIILPNSLKKIEGEVFWDCTRLNKVEMPDGLEHIEYNAFYDCCSLKEIAIPESVIYLGSGVFENCKSLQKVNIPQRITSISSGLFNNCESLHEITIPEMVTHIGFGAFEKCSELNSIIIPQNVKKIEFRAFMDCTSLKSIKIPESVSEISLDTFKGCTSLETIELNEGLRVIDSEAFSDCKKIKEIDIPSTVHTIGYKAFGDCANLKYIEVPKEVKDIEMWAFSGCSSLENIKLNTGLVSIGNFAFYNCSNLRGIDIPDTVCTIGESAFRGCQNIKSIVIPDNVSRIEEQTFSNCINLISIEIPDSVTVIGESAFYNCHKLKKLIIPEGVSELNDFTFWECSSLAEVMLPKNLKTIGNYCFAKCSNLATITIPKTVTSIGDTAFGYEYGDKVVISCYKNSYAHRHAKENGYSYYLIDAPKETTYKITYVLNGGKNNSANPSTYKSSSNTITLKNPTRSGYEFAGWYSNKECYIEDNTIERGSMQNITFYAKWVKKYTITYVLNGGKNHASNPAKYDKDSRIVLKNPTKKGYKFKGWYSDSNYRTKVTEISYGSTGNKKLYAKWEIVNYSITYSLGGGKNNSANPAKYKVTTSTITLKNPTRKGYTFKGWYSDSKYKTKVTKIEKGSTGNKKLYAKWEIANYSISYSLGGGTNNESNPATYTIGTSTITLKNPTRKGYTFKGWYSDSKYKTKVTKIEKGSTGNKKLYAKWEIVNYSITYSLGGGKNNSANPAKYKVTTSTITLKNPTKKGYTFKGWYSDSKYKTKVTKIAKGSTGNRKLYAKWVATKYSISYSLGGGTNNVSNPATYTIGTSTITLKNPTRKGYTFKGWYSDSKYKTKVTKIVKGSTGNKKLYAKWEIVNYSIAYSLGGGKNNSANPAKYKVTTSTITLKNPTKKGYTFKGWYSDSKYKTKVTEIAKGSTGNRKLYAKWAATKYSISYSLGGGTNNVSNPATYTIGTSTITLKNPIRKGYTFKGWYSDSGYKTKITEIAQGSTGNKKLYAKWMVNQYTIIFDGNGSTSGSMKNMENCKYETSYSLTPNTFKRTGYSFSGWNTKTDGSGIFYNNESSIKNLCSESGGSSVLYAQWEKYGGKIEQEYGNIKWWIDDKGKLTVTGTGDFSDETGSSRAPWNKHAAEIKSAKIDVTGMKNASAMFYGCTAMKSVDLSGFDTSNVTNMERMFYSCKSLETIDLSQFNTSKVTDMSGMFAGCRNVKVLDLSAFNTSNVTDMSDMFVNCGVIKELDLQGFDTSKVTDMSCMFDQCYSMEELNICNFDTRNVTNMHNMFERCEMLAKLDLSSFDTSKVTDMSFMFYRCKLLNELDLSGFDTSNVTSMAVMFGLCTSLEELDLSGFDMINVNCVMGEVNEDNNYKMMNALYACNSLKKIKTPSNCVLDVELPKQLDEEHWYNSEGTLIELLPKGLSESVTICKK